MTPGRLRAGIVIALIVVCSALAGVAVERVVIPRVAPRRHHGLGRGSPEQDAHRRKEMLDRMTKDLELSVSQRAGIDSVMRRSDSLLREIRTEMQPRLEKVFQSSRVEIETRLDKDQRAKFEKIVVMRKGQR